MTRKAASSWGNVIARAERALIQYGLIVDWKLINNDHAGDAATRRIDMTGSRYGYLLPLIAVDGCLPSDLGAGASSELEEERRLLYVAMTRAKDDLHLITPQRFYTHNQPALGDRHVYAARTRFIPKSLLGLFEKTNWPVAAQGAGAAATPERPKIVVVLRLRSMWR